MSTRSDVIEKIVDTSTCDRFIKVIYSLNSSMKSIYENACQVLHPLSIFSDIERSTWKELFLMCKKNNIMSETNRQHTIFFSRDPLSFETYCEIYKNNAKNEHVHFIPDNEMHPAESFDVMILHGLEDVKKHNEKHLKPKGVLVMHLQVSLINYDEMSKILLKFNETFIFRSQFEDPTNGMIHLICSGKTVCGKHSSMEICQALIKLTNHFSCLRLKFMEKVQRILKLGKIEDINNLLENMKNEVKCKSQDVQIERIQKYLDGNDINISTSEKAIS
jgi:hypothetical protein